MGYSTIYGLQNYYEEGIISYQTMLLRFFSSLGSHGLWAGIEASAIIIAMKTSYFGALSDKKFWIWVSIPVLIHFVWDLIAFSNLSEALSYVLLVVLQVIQFFIFGFFVELIIKETRQSKLDEEIVQDVSITY